MLDFDIEEKIKEQKFKDSHNGFSKEDYLKFVAQHGKENPRQVKYDNWLNENKDRISWFRKPRFVFTKTHRRIAFALLNINLLAFCISMFALPMALFLTIILAIPMNFIAAIILFNINNYDVKHCIHGCSDLHSEIVGEQREIGTGHIVVKCKKCGVYRVGTEHIGYD